MHFFQRLPIKQKLTLVILATTALTLLFACTALFIFQYTQIRERLVINLKGNANLLSEYSRAALLFDQDEDARNVLQALLTQKGITAAAIYRNDGSLLADYILTGSKGKVPDRPDETGARFRNNHLIYSLPILDRQEQGRRMGWLYLQSDLSPITEATRFYLMLVGGVLVSSLIAAFLLATRFQGWITGPLQRLAMTADAVATRKDYSVRVENQSADEIGLFAQAFNQMLSQIQDQDAALRKSNDELEHRVQERTRELTWSKKDLESTLALLRATLDATLDGILVVASDEKIVSYNQKFIQMWRIPPEVIRCRNDSEVISFVLDQIVDPERFLLKVKETYQSVESDSHDVVHFKDGRIFERFSQPHRVEGKAIGRVWSFRDITERERFTAEIRERTDKLQRFQNLTVSRELQMVKLKEEVNSLLLRAGQSPKYQAPDRIKQNAVPID